MLPESKKNNEEKQRLTKAKHIDDRYTLYSTKVRVIVSCGFYNAPRCIYSNNSFGSPKVTRNLQYIMLDQFTKNGYVFGNKVTVEKSMLSESFVTGTRFSPTTTTLLPEIKVVEF